MENLTANAFYTWCLWVSAFNFASAGIHVWTVPTMFNELSRLSPTRLRRRQALYSTAVFAFAAFFVFYAFTQYPDIQRSWVDVALAGLLAFIFGLMALSGWVQTVIRAVRKGAKTAQRQDAI